MPTIGKSKGKPISKIQFNIILKRFLVFLKRELRLTYDIPIVFVDDANFAKRIEAFGEMTKENVIHLSIINRHPMDIFRTLAHEYVHYKQHLEKGINHKDSKAGSLLENQANAKSGEIIRKYASLHPEIFDFVSLK